MDAARTAQIRGPGPVAESALKEALALTAQASAPLILTLRLDEASQSYFDALRNQHFPAHRNFLAAHLTLFHHLPGECLDRVADTLRIRAANQPPLVLTVTGPRLLGHGVAFRLECRSLRELHRHLQRDFEEVLTPQDRQGLAPHVTVQNKVDPAMALELHKTLAARFHPFDGQGLGLDLWRYLGGPWERVASFPFQAGSEART